MGINQQIAVMQAFAEGKKIEIRGRHNKEWSDIEDPSWNWVGFDYRIKPEPKLRPYTFDELQAEMAKGKIAIKLKGVNRIFTITQVMDDYDKDSKIQLSNLTCVSYELFLNNCQWIDGSSCGVIEE